MSEQPLQRHKGTNVTKRLVIRDKAARGEKYIKDGGGLTSELSMARVFYKGSRKTYEKFLHDKERYEAIRVCVVREG